MRNKNKTHLGTITILVKDRYSQAPDVNQILTKHGSLILARLGVNLQPHCIEHCTAMITVAVSGTMSNIRSLTKELDEIYGIVAKTNIMTE